MASLTTARPSIAALALPAQVGAAQVLLPAGEFRAPRGALLGGSGPWHLSAERGATLAAALAARHADLVVDYEHQTLRAVTNGQPAPASGWVRPPEVAFDPAVGVTAAIHWTERAAAAIGAGEYRYLSPVFTFDPQTGEVMDLLHLALTNNPAIDLPEAALAAASSLSFHLTQETAAMADLSGALRERVLHLFQLPLTSTDADLVRSLDALTPLLQGSDGTAAASLPDLLRTSQAQVAALTAQVQAAPTPALVADLQGQVAALTAAAETQTRATLLAAARADGRLLPGSALDTHCAGLTLAALSALLPGLTPLAALAGTQTGGQAPAGVAAAAAGTDDLEQYGGSAELRDAYQRAAAEGRVRIYGDTAQ